MEAMSNPDVDDEWNERVEEAVGDLLIEIEESINDIFKNTWKELFGYSKEYFQEKESEVQDAS
jgi:hypothetical protein